MRGIKVDEDTLAFDVIRSVGCGGHFLADDHTVRHVRKEFFMPKVSDRQTRIKWEEGGCLTAEDRARRIVDKVLAKHIPTPVSKELKEKIRSRFPSIQGEELY